MQKCCIIFKNRLEILKMMNRLRNFMYGRYGMDGLNVCLWVFALAVMLIASVFSFIPSIPGVVSLILRIVSTVLLVLTIFRSFSRNIAARQKENYSFMKIWNKVKQFFRRIKAAFIPRPDRKTHKYFRCPKCSQKVRVPKGKGKIAIKCPKCGEKFIRKT